VKVLFDANVVLDVLLKRPGFSQAAMAIAKVPEPWLSTLSLANILYIVGRSKAGRIEGPLAYMRSKFRLAALTLTGRRNWAGRISRMPFKWPWQRKTEFPFWQQRTWPIFDPTALWRLSPQRRSSGVRNFETMNTMCQPPEML